MMARGVHERLTGGRRVRPRRMRLVPAALAAAALAMAGCTQMWPGPNQGGVPPISANDPHTSSNIVRVNKIFSSDPWLCFNPDGSNRIDGMKFTLYLEAVGRPRGVFGTGTIVVSLYRLDRDPDGRDVAALVQEWEFSAEQAYPWRARKESYLGWGYGLRLPWDPRLDLAGRQIAVVAKYVREDGRVVSSSRKVLRVPPGTAPTESRAVAERAPRSGPMIEPINVGKAPASGGRR